MKTTVEPERKRYWEDIAWVDEHIDELTRKYGSDHELIWIAVFNKEVVAFGPDRGQVRRKAAEKTGKPADEIFIDFIEGRAAIL